MPRKTLPKKFKYTTRKNGELYVKFPVPGFKYPLWRKCVPETQARVDEIIAVLLEDNEKNSPKPGAAKDFADFFALWLSSIKSRVTVRTYQGYEAIFRRYLSGAIGHLHVSEVKPTHLQNLYQSLSERGLGGVTVRKAHTVASMVFRQAVNLDLIAVNPAARAQPPTIQRSLKIKALNLEEVKKLLAACALVEQGIIFEFALETGMRPSEYLALRWTDVDFEKQSVSVTRALVTEIKGGGFYFKPPKTKRGRRTVSISAQLAAKLEIHREKQSARLAEISRKVQGRYKPSLKNRRALHCRMLENHASLNLVFPSEDFTPIKENNLGRRYFKQALKTAVLSSDFSLYHLRHTCATLLLAANVNTKIVSERLGHSSVALTLDTYSHVLPHMQGEATEKLTDVLYR